MFLNLDIFKRYERISKDDFFKGFIAPVTYKINKLFTDMKLAIKNEYKATRGPSFTLIQFGVEPYINLKKVRGIADNISLATSISNIRVHTPVAGTPYIGVEVPNKTREIISLGEVLGSKTFAEKSKDMELPVAFGKSLNGYLVKDLAKAPHLLVAGTTGSGKSICLNSIILSLIASKSPDEIKLILIDSKIVEFSIYNGIPHLIKNKVKEKDLTINFDFLIQEMRNRYELLSKKSVRDIKSYNELVTGKKKLPYIVLIIDEFADFINSGNRKTLEEKIQTLASMSRAVGIHLVIATQRPSVDVITGTIKSNLPARIAFKTVSAIDSKTILGFSGAEKLLGKGDMFFMETEESLKRVQCSYVSDEEVKKSVEHIKETVKPLYNYGYIITDEVGDLEEDGEEDVKEGVSEEDNSIENVLGMTTEEFDEINSMSMAETFEYINNAEREALKKIKEENDNKNPVKKFFKWVFSD
jgi:S-DNA-T family DNA segregation ATPase FtsK/SpoIIIE